MKRITHVKILFLAIMIALLVNPAYAAPVSSLPGGTIIPMPGVNYFGSGPQTFGPGNSITWTSTNVINQGGSVFGYTGGYGFGDNGYWDGSLDPMTGVNSAAYVYSVTDTMTFAFSTPVKGVGGFINYYPDQQTPTTIAVYDTNMNLIESEALTFHTGGSANSGEFHGFLESSPTIKYFTLSDNYVGITKLTIDTGSGLPAPEFPSAFLPATMIIGFLGAVLLIQRTREH